MSSFDVVQCCRKHAQKKINLNDRTHALAVLKAESHKRVESFLFEALFESSMGEIPSSSGWLFQYDEEDVPSHWFRLVTEKHPWRDDCDGALLSLLRGREVEITRVFPSEDGTKFLADRHRNGQWSDRKTLEEVLSGLVGRATPKTNPRNYRSDSIDTDRRARAIEATQKLFDGPSLSHLCAQRLLVNCHLWPWYRKQPMDIDSIIMSDDGLRFVEFKRKYPSRRGTFGIDRHPHGMFIDWLNERGHPLLHVLLIDPLWDKNESPLHLLEKDSPTSEHALWLGIELRVDVFRQEGGLQTQGSDSGMFGGERDQRELDPEMALLGEGVRPDRLTDYLKDPDQLPIRNLLDYMQNCRQAARKQFY